MTHRAKSFIVCLIGLLIIFFGWTYESRLVWDIGIITFVIAFLVSLVKHDAVSLTPTQKVKKEKPISAAEYERGRKDLVEWLEGFIAEGYGDRLMFLVMKLKQKPSFVLQEVKNETQEGIGFLNSYILNNRDNWREHYSEEEWLEAKKISIHDLSKMDKDKMDEPFLLSCDGSYSANQLIEAIKAENELGIKQILMMLRWLNREKK